MFIYSYIYIYLFLNYAYIFGICFHFNVHFICLKYGYNNPIQNIFIFLRYMHIPF